MGLFTPLAIRIGALSWMPKLLPQVVWVDTRLQRLTRGRTTVLDIAGLPNLALTVPGRKSGIPRTTPLLCVPHEGGWLVAGSYFGGPNVPLWVGNLRACEHAAIRFDGVEHTVTWREIEPGPSATESGRSCSARGRTSPSTRSAPHGSSRCSGSRPSDGSLRQSVSSPVLNAESLRESRSQRSCAESASTSSTTSSGKPSTSGAAASGTTVCTIWSS